jgi:hypothetical protein
MRQIAPIQGHAQMKRAMIYTSSDGVYLFLYDAVQDGPCTADYLFDSIELAQQDAAKDYGISLDAWQVIPDPPAGAQHDWIAPTRVRVDADGKKLWGQFESIADVTPSPNQTMQRTAGRSDV